MIVAFSTYHYNKNVRRMQSLGGLILDVELQSGMSVALMLTIVYMFGLRI